jgi:hypothetical protein
MNKTAIAVIAGTILLQSAAIAADSTDSKATESTSVVGKTAKKKSSFGKAISHVFGSKSDKDLTKSVATAEPAQGAY